jgi:hypothetical protein
MWPDAIVLFEPPVDDGLTFKMGARTSKGPQGKNDSPFRNSSLKPALKLSQYPFSRGDPSMM